MGLHKLQEFNTFQPRKTTYLPHLWSNKSFKDTVVNLALQPWMKGRLKFRLQSLYMLSIALDSSSRCTSLALINEHRTYFCIFYLLKGLSVQFQVTSFKEWHAWFTLVEPLFKQNLRRHRSCSMINVVWDTVIISAV